jgi:hypothetical protein
MTARELASAIGTTVAVREKGFAWHATVLDAKEVYGSLRFQVTPVAGIGTVWVESSRTTTV